MVSFGTSILICVSFLPAMEQFQQIGEVLGSLNALMMFRDEIQINQHQCCLLVDVYNQGFEVIAEEMRHNLKFNEKLTKWNGLERIERTPQELPRR